MEALSMADLLAQTNQTLREYGLYQQGWRAAESAGKRIAGYCNYNAKLISLSRVLMMKATYAEQNETILHEVAHALTPGHSHDHVWKAKLIEMGGTGKRTHDIETPKGRYKIMCPKCGEITTRHMLSGAMKHLLNPTSWVTHTHNGCGARLFAVDTVTGRGGPHVNTLKTIDAGLNQILEQAGVAVPTAASKPTPKPAEGPACRCGCGDRTRGGMYLPGHDARHVSEIFAHWLESDYTTDVALLMLDHAPKLAAKLRARIEAHATKNYK